MLKGKSLKRAVMKEAARYRKGLGHSKSAALREAWAYYASTEPRKVSKRRKRAKR